MSPYRILSVDGGGIRGLYAAALLDRLLADVPGLLDRVNLFAGTSTGAIIALGLARGVQPKDLVALYRDNARQIFHLAVWRTLEGLDGFCRAKYDDKDLANALEAKFGKMTLADLSPKRVLVPTFDLDNEGARGRRRMWKPKFFHNFPGPDSDGDQRVVDVALRSSAAPTYFPTYQGYIDGGVVANNPSMAALAQALDAQTGGQVLSDIRLFSLGTGTSPAYLPGQLLDWGIARWAKPIHTLMIDGMMGVADYQCARLLSDSYCRLAPDLPEPVLLDAVDKIDELIADANQVDISTTVTWLKHQF